MEHFVYKTYMAFEDWLFIITTVCMLHFYVGDTLSLSTSISEVSFSTLLSKICLNLDVSRHLNFVKFHTTFVGRREYLAWHLDTV
jgi:hypothetical protein